MDIMAALRQVISSIKLWVDENKVQKINGKGLSSNDYTAEDKEKVNNIANGLLLENNKLYLSKDGEPIYSGVSLPSSGSGSSGGSSTQPDYNQNDPTAADYIKNRPFYAGDLVETELVDVDAFMAANGLEWMPMGDDTVDGTNFLWQRQCGYICALKDGKEYSLVINGNKYTAIADSINVWGYDSIYIGDIEALYSDDLENFTYLVEYFPKYDESVIVYKSPEAPTECKIYSHEREIVKIDPKYLPEGGVGYTTTTATELLPETTIQADMLWNRFDNNIDIVSNHTYKVTHNGVDYTCIANEDGIIGNMSIWADWGEDTLEPFVTDGYEIAVRGSNNNTIEIICISDSDGNPVEEVIFEETLLTDMHVVPVYIYDCNLTNKHRYVVLFDGIEYTCYADGYIEEGYSFIYIGNSYLDSDEECNNTEEPFFVGCYMESYDDATYCETYIVASELGTHTIKIIDIDGSQVHKIDPKFLPDHIQSDWNENDPNAEGHIANRPFYEVPVAGEELLAEQTVETTEVYIQISDSLTFVEGETYFVAFNGETYECVAWVGDVDDAICIGNGNIYGGYGLGDDVPFSCDSYSNGECYLNVINNGTHTIKIQSATMAVAKKIDKKFLPDDIGSTQSDWNQNDEAATDYIKNRPFYSYDFAEVETEVLAEQTIVAEPGLSSRYFNKNLMLVEGKTYIVTLNGETYECVAWVGSDSFVRIGNGDFYCDAGKGNDVPFLIDSFYLYAPNNEDYSVKIVCIEQEEKVKKIDSKYLDLNLSWNNLEDKPFSTDVTTKFAYMRDFSLERVECHLYGSNMSLMKISNDVPSKESFIGNYIKYTLFLSTKDNTVDVVTDITEEIVNNCLDVNGTVYSSNIRYEGSLYKIDSMLVVRETTDIYSVGSNGNHVCTLSPGIWCFSYEYYQPDSGAATISVEIAYSNVNCVDDVYIPDTIARKTDLESVIDGVNDTLAGLAPIAITGSWNDLTDKPFGYGSKIYEWLSDIEYTEKADMFVKVSDDAPDKSDVIGGKLYADVTMGDDSLQQELPIEEDMVADAGEGAFAVSEMILVVTADTFDFNGSTLTKGVWMVDFAALAAEIGHYNKVQIIIAGDTKTLDEKYIPDTIARVADIEALLCNLSDKTIYVKWNVNGEYEFAPDPIGDALMKLSDKVPSMDSIVGATFEVTQNKDGQTTTDSFVITTDKVAETDYGYTLGFAEYGGSYFITAESATINDVVLTKGVWCQNLAKVNDYVEFKIFKKFVTSVNGMTGDVVISGGGSGGVSSWNDLTDKPFYDVEPVCEPIYEDVTVSLTSSTDEQDVACLIGTVVEVEPNLTIVAGEKYKLLVNGAEYFGIAKNMPPIYPIPEHDEKKTGFIVEFQDNNNNLVYTVSLLKPEYYYYNSIIESIWLEQYANYNSVVFTSYDLNLGETTLISLYKVIVDAQKINPKYVYRSDWNENDGTKPEYVKNRPFYKDQRITEELIFDGKYVFDELGEGHYLPSPFDNFKDESYIVEWDGVRYDCRARYQRDQDDNSIELGWETRNDSSIEPFRLFAGNTKDNGIMWAYLKEVTTPQEVHRCKIYRKSQNWLYDQDFIYAMQPDWDEDDKNSKNYIKNKICSRKTTDYMYLIDEKEPIYIDSSAGDNVLYTTTVQVSCYPIENKTYSVTIGSNSVDDLPYTGGGYIGNRYLFDGDSRYNTGEPVLVVFSKDGTAMIFTTYSEVGRTRVYGSAYKYSPIDELYLPSYFPRARQANVGDVVVVAATGTTTSTYKVPTQWRATNIESLIPPTDWDTVQNKPFGEIAEKLDEIFNQDLNFVNYTAGLYVAELTDGALVNSINPGGTYVVNWDGEEYTCIESMAEEPGDQMLLGNMGIANGQNGTGEPFCIIIMPGQGTLIATTSSDSQHHLEIYNASLSVLHLDEKYIPNSVAKASTAQVGQTIVVKSIDENGKPTEWECVDMPSWIPEITEADEGAILRVVNGVPTWVQATDAQDATF